MVVKKEKKITFISLERPIVNRAFAFVFSIHL